MGNNIAHALQEKGMWRSVRTHGATCIANLVPPIPLPSTNYLISVFLEDDNHKGIVRWGNVLPKRIINKINNGGVGR